MLMRHFPRSELGLAVGLLPASVRPRSVSPRLILPASGTDGSPPRLTGATLRAVARTPTAKSTGQIRTLTTRASTLGKIHGGRKPPEKLGTGAKSVRCTNKTSDDLGVVLDGSELKTPGRLPFRGGATRLRCDSQLGQESGPPRAADRGRAARSKRCAF